MSRSPSGITVAQLAANLRCEPELIANCIALHTYSKRKIESHLLIPLPCDYRVPGHDELITPQALAETNAGRMEVVERKIAVLLEQMERAEELRTSIENRTLPGLEKWMRHVALEDGTRVWVRPGTPQDADLYPAFLAKMTPEDMRLRFFGRVKDTGAAFIARLTQFDRAHAMAFIATHTGTGEMLGVARLHADPEHAWGEFAVAVRSDFKGRGLGPRLMEVVIDFARHLDFDRIEGQVLTENTGMLAMSEALGFGVSRQAGEPAILRLTLNLKTLQDGFRS